MSNRLPVPIRRVLREPLDEARLERAHAKLRARGAPSRRSVAQVAPAVVAAAIVVAVVVASLRPRDSGPLRLSDGSAVPATLAIEPASLRLTRFDDGSEIALGADAALRTLENDEREIGFLLERGSATFDVRPDGPRRWTIDCGLATVIVVGTRFSIERTAESARIEVSRGAVLVRGERVPDRVRRLGPDETLVIEDPPPVAVDVEPAAAPAAESIEPPPSEIDHEPIRARRSEPPSDAWRSHAAARDWDGAYAELGERGIARASRSATVTELVALADVARLSGHPSAAIPPLELIVFRHPRDPSAPLSAFSLGRVESQLGRHGRAARAFALALELGLPPSLRSDAVARLAMSHRDAGDRADAAEAAARYLDAFPRERHADTMREILGATR